MNDNLVVTGALGFIGSNLVQRLLSVQSQPIILVDTYFPEPNKQPWLKHQSLHFELHRDFLKKIGQGKIRASAIFHLGACSDTTEEDWDFLRTNNVEYSQRLWTCCAECEIPFIYASSAATYGDGTLGFDDKTPPIDLQPLNLYGRSKNDFDKWVIDKVKKGVPEPKGWAGLKFFNVYGPREAQKGRMASMVWHSYRQIHEKGEVALFKSDTVKGSDGGHRRDFVFVGDCVDHLIWLWRNPEVCGIFNSGSGQDRSFLELAEAVFTALDIPSRIRYIDIPDDLRGKYQSYTKAVMGKLESAGYKGCPTSLESGVDQTIKWLKTELTTGCNSKV